MKEKQFFGSLCKQPLFFTVAFIFCEAVAVITACAIATLISMVCKLDDTASLLFAAVSALGALALVEKIANHPRVMRFYTNVKDSPVSADSI